MYLISLLSLVSLVAVSMAARLEPAPLSDAHINYINSIDGLTWKAGRNFGPNDLPYVKKLLGVDLGAEDLYTRLHMPVLEPEPVDEELPENFDGRQRWPNCDSFKEIRDQSACGSCWAFGSAEAISDRICAATGKNVHISAQDLTSCCTECGSGCRGGSSVLSWSYYRDEGIVTGGQFNSSQGCRPYSLPPCEHHGTGPLPSCKDFHFETPECQRSCLKGYPKTYEQDKHKASKVYSIKGVENIMQQIYTKGSVSASFRVYADFLTYKSGVYKRVSERAVGGHAVKIIGWGVENGVDYWLVANSWNTHWGDKGFFKILRGVDECRIEHYVAGGDPQE